MARIETKRLILRSWKKSDLLSLYKIYSNPVVMKHYVGGPLDLGKTANFLKIFMDHQKLYGYSYWAIILKDTGKLIGQCGIRSYFQWGETGMGYLLDHEYWDNGYATEAAEKALEIAFKEHGIPEITAWVIPENRRSVNIIEKLGMKYSRSDFYKNELFSVYSILNPFPELIKKVIIPYQVCNE